MDVKENMHQAASLEEIECPSWKFFTSSLSPYSTLKTAISDPLFTYLQTYLIKSILGQDIDMSFEIYVRVLHCMKLYTGFLLQPFVPPCPCPTLRLKQWPASSGFRH